MKQDLILRGCRSLPGRIPHSVRTLREILGFCTHYRKTGCVPVWGLLVGD